jgi:hypothetical protein
MYIGTRISAMWNNNVYDDSKVLKVGISVVV